MLKFLAKRRFNNLDWLTAVVAISLFPAIGWWVTLICLAGVALSTWAEYATGEA